MIQGSPDTDQVYDVGSSPSFLAACNIDGDTHSDLITANAGSDDVTVLFNDGSGGFPDRPDYDVGTGPTHVACGHLDCDRRADLVTASSADRGLTIRDLSVDSGSLSWSGWPGALTYDAVRGDLHTLRSTGGDFSASVLHCVLGGVAGTSAGGVTDPATGQAFWYLVRSLDAFGRNTYDTVEGSQRSRRDPGTEAAAGDCP